MKFWRTLIVILSLALVAPNPVMAATPNAVEVKPVAAETGLAVQPYLQNPAADAVTIAWRSAQRSFGWVEYGETPALGKKAYRVIDGLREANTVEHRVRLTGLAAGKSYYYRAVDQVITEYGANRPVFGETLRGEIRNFRLPDPAAGKATVCILNDLHNNLPMFEALAAQACKQDPDAVLFNGDCFANPASLERFVPVLSAFTAGIEAGRRPAFFIRGNHEARGGYARSLKTHFEYPEGEYYFAWTLGPVRFIALDAGEDKADDHQEYFGLNDFTAYRAAQAEWLRREVASEAYKKATYHVLVHHIPLYGRRGRYGNTGMDGSRGLWEPVLREAGIDVAVCGHTHHRKIWQAGETGNPWPVVVGGGSSFQQEPVVTVVRADEEGLRVEQINREGKVVEGITIKRK